MDARLVKIGDAAALLGTKPDTLRKWESTGELLPARKTRGGTRYYAISDIMGSVNEGAPTVGYARVSGQRQRDDLSRQQEMLETYGAAKGWKLEVISDLGSGMNYAKPGLQDLLERILTSADAAAGYHTQRPTTPLRRRSGIRLV